MSPQKTTHPMGEWVLHLRNLDSRLRGNDKGSATAFSRLIKYPLRIPNQREIDVLDKSTAKLSAALIAKTILFESLVSVS